MSIDWAAFEREQEEARRRGEEEGRLIVAIRRAQAEVTSYETFQRELESRGLLESLREFAVGEGPTPPPSAPGPAPAPGEPTPPVDPWESLADLVNRMGGGFTLPQAPGAVTGFVPETRRRFSPLIWVALLVVAGGGGYWWYTQRKRGKRSNHSRGGES